MSVIGSLIKKGVFSTIRHPLWSGGGGKSHNQGLFNFFGNAQSCYAIKMTPTIKCNMYSYFKNIRFIIAFINYRIRSLPECPQISIHIFYPYQRLSALAGFKNAPKIVGLLQSNSRRNASIFALWVVRTLGIDTVRFLLLQEVT